MEPVTIPKPAETFDPAFFQVLFEAEDRHFWFRARNRVIAKVIQGLVAAMQPGYKVLEVGCGTGNVLRVLEQTCTRGSVVGMDLFNEGLHYARQRTSCALVMGDTRHPPFAHQFNLVCLFDVLEHIPEDVLTMQDLHRLLLPGGTLFLTVPSRPELWSYFDVASCHRRRYQLGGLEQKLLGAGLEVDYISEFMAALFPLAWLKRRLLGSSGRALSPSESREQAMREFRVFPLLNGILSWLLSLESGWIARRRRLPFGTSILVLAHKPGRP